MSRSIAVILAGALALAPAPAAGAAPPAPEFELRIKPLDWEKPVFAIRGSVAACAPEGAKVRFIVGAGSAYSFSRGGKPLDVSAPKGLAWPCGAGPEPVRFEGRSAEGIRRCGASGDELFCLNNSAPNPEVVSARSRYRIEFELPEGAGALAPDPELELGSGIQFQLARFAKPLRVKTRRFTVEYLFPEGFVPEPAYPAFLEETLERYLDLFGPLPFRLVKVGAIRRGQKTGEISGSPAGNLILFSRTALKDKPGLAGLEAAGIRSDVSDALRRMVIAHELSHFWFGQAFSGREGWMVEGIPNYLGLVEVSRRSRGDYAELLKLFEFMDSRGPLDAIPGRPFGDGPLYIKAYYQGALALARAGEAVGHDRLIRLVAAVFKSRAEPSFADFDRAFRKEFPGQTGLWERAWRIEKRP